jgi:hypothetical protein
LPTIGSKRRKTIREKPHQIKRPEHVLNKREQSIVKNREKPHQIKRPEHVLNKREQSIAKNEQVESVESVDDK